MKTIARMKKIAALLATVPCLLLGVVPSLAGPQIYKSNVLTALHVTIPGTHVAVVPPSGSVPAVNYRGFEIENREIQYEVLEQATAYSALEPTLTAEHLLEQEIEIQDITKVVLNERPATLMTGRKTADTRSNAAGETEGLGVVLFVFGNERLTVSIYGYYPISDRSALGLLRNSMLSAIFQPTQSENAGGTYTLSTAGTLFRFAGEVNEARQYRLDDSSGRTEPDEAATELARYSATMLRQNVSQPEWEKFAEETFASYMPSDQYTISDRRNVSYGGLSGIELTSDFEGLSRRRRTASGGMVRRSVPGKGYQTVLFDSSGRLFVFQGLALRDAETYLAQFRKITATFTLTK